MSLLIDLWIMIVISKCKLYVINRNHEIGMPLVGTHRICVDLG